MSATSPILVPIPGVPDHMPEGRACLCFEVDMTHGTLINGQYIYLVDIGIDPISNKMSCIRGMYVNNPSNVGIDISVNSSNQEVFIDINTQENFPIFSFLPCQLIITADQSINQPFNIILTNYEIPTVLGEY